MSQAAEQVPAAATARPGSVEHWALTRPSVVAFVEGDRSLTWGELNDHADRLAAALPEPGIKAGDVVGVRNQIRNEWSLIADALAKLRAALTGMNWLLIHADVQVIHGHKETDGLTPAYNK